jgi:hypothetical protein
MRVRVYGNYDLTFRDFFRYWGFLAWLQTAAGRRLLHRGFERRNVEPWTQGLADFFLEDKLVRLARAGSAGRD